MTGNLYGGIISGGIVVFYVIDTYPVLGKHFFTDLAS